MTIDGHKNKYLEREELKRQIKEKQGWYFIANIRELPTHRPYGFTLFNKPFVLFKDNSDSWVCYLLPSTTSKEEKAEVQLLKIVENDIWIWRGKR